MSKCKLSTFCVVSFLFLAAWASTAHAQAPTIGSVTGVGLFGGDGHCPTNGRFYSPNQPGMTCYSATITGCSQTLDLIITFGYLPRAAGTNNNGTIVLLSGDGGRFATTNPENTYAAEYITKGYNIVEVAYLSEWQDAGGLPGGTGQFTNNVINAACRPATFLNFVRYNTQPPVMYTAGGMCAQGISGGTDQIAYSLVYYGAYNYLDKAEMEAGPPFGNINVGCSNPTPPPQPICTKYQTHCQGWPDGGILPSDPVDYMYTGTLAENNISNITATGNDPVYHTASCTDTYGTTQSWSSAWDAQSVAPQTNPTGIYSFPQTSIQAWLCASTDSGEDLNNSGYSGNYFYSKVAQVNGTPFLNVTAVEMCNGPEGVDGNNAWISNLNPIGPRHSLYAGQASMASIAQDMANYNGTSQTVACQSSPR